MIEVADWEGFARRRESKKRGKLLRPRHLELRRIVDRRAERAAAITVRPDGHVEVVIGTQPSGQGHETSFAQVVADLLHVPVETVNIILGDTDVVKVGGGTHSGRSMRHAATVFPRRAELIAKGKRVAAIILETPPDEIEFNDGRFSSRDSNRSFDFLELAKEAARPCAARQSDRTGIAVVPTTRCTIRSSPTAARSARSRSIPRPVRFDITRYASVDDVGRCINPLIVDGQTHGAHRARHRPGDVGAVLRRPNPASRWPARTWTTACRAPTRVPPFKTEIAEVLSPTNPLGIKAGGEGGITPAPAVIVSAHRRRAARLRRSRHQDAGNALHDLEDDPGRQSEGDGKREKRREEMMPTSRRTTLSTLGVCPGRSAAHKRSGALQTRDRPEPAAVPDQRCTARAHALALHRIRDTGSWRGIRTACGERSQCWARLCWHRR